MIEITITLPRAHFEMLKALHSLFENPSYPDSASLQTQLMILHAVTALYRQYFPKGHPDLDESPRLVREAIDEQYQLIWEANGKQEKA